MHHVILLLLLTCAAGTVDAISYLGLGHVFTAMMTGNTVLLGLAIGQGHLGAAVRSVVALIGFSLGVILGAVIVQRKGEDAAWPIAVTRTLAVEAVLLGAFALLWYLAGPDRSEYLLYILIALTAVAMGLQSAAVQRLGVPGVMTTYITGTLTTLMAQVARRLRMRSPWAATPPSASPAGRTGILAAVFVAYGCGALAGGFLELHVFSFAVVLPFVLVGIVVISAIAIRPA